MAEEEKTSPPPEENATPPTMEDDPIWAFIGKSHVEGPTDVAENKHKYLAEAYEKKYRRSSDAK